MNSQYERHLSSVSISTPASAATWVVWLAIPITLLTACALLVGYLEQWHLSRTGYWRIQESWMIALNGTLSAWPAALWLNLTRMGDAMVLIPILAPVALWRPPVLIAILGAIPAASAFSVVGKKLAAIPRPAGVLDQNEFIILGRILKGDNSLPSGHSITVFAGIIVIIASFAFTPRTLRQWSIVIAGIGAGVVLCLSRVALGAHWPLDLLVGGAAGWLAGLCGVSLARCYATSWEGFTSPISRALCGIVLTLWGVFLSIDAYSAETGSLTLWLAAACVTFSAGWVVRQFRQSTFS